MAALVLALGASSVWAQESKPAPAPAAAETKDKDKASEKEAPLPADAHVAQSILLDGKALHYTVSLGTLPFSDNGKKIGEVVCTAYTI